MVLLLCILIKILLCFYVGRSFASNGQFTKGNKVGKVKSYSI